MTPATNSSSTSTPTRPAPPLGHLVQQNRQGPRHRHPHRPFRKSYRHRHPLRPRRSLTAERPSRRLQILHQRRELSVCVQLHQPGQLRRHQERELRQHTCIHHSKSQRWRPILTTHRRPRRNPHTTDPGSANSSGQVTNPPPPQKRSFWQKMNDNAAYQQQHQGNNAPLSTNGSTGSKPL
jgi:hypothetical protein